MTVTRIGIINSRYSCQLSANLRFKLLPPRTLTAALLFTMIPTFYLLFFVSRNVSRSSDSTIPQSLMHVKCFLKFYTGFLNNSALICINLSDSLTICTINFARFPVNLSMKNHNRFMKQLYIILQTCYTFYSKIIFLLNKEVFP